LDIHFHSRLCISWWRKDILPKIEISFYKSGGRIRKQLDFILKYLICDLFISGGGNYEVNSISLDCSYVGIDSKLSEKAGS
jgi:hypothetical protein